MWWNELGYTFRDRQGPSPVVTEHLHLKVRSAAKGHPGDETWHWNILSLATLFNFGEILDSALFCQNDLSFSPFIPTRFSLRYSFHQNFTRVQWKSCIKVFLSSFVGKPWVLKFGWISNVWYLICLRELYLGLVWMCNAQISSFISCLPGQLRSQRKTRNAIMPTSSWVF